MSLLRIAGAIVLYVIVCGLLVWWKPAAMFDENYQPRNFGLMEVEHNQSIFAPVVVFPLLAVLAYFVMGFLELIRPAAPRAFSLKI